MTSTTPTAGGTLAAAAALQGPQQMYTRDQVAYLMHLAYDAGRTAAWLEDVAREHCTSLDNATLRRTYEQRVADEIAEMGAYARRRSALERRPYREYRGGPVDWETGAPARHLGAVA